MENSILLDYKSVLDRNKNTLLNILKSYSDDNPKLSHIINNIEEIYNHKLKNIKPYIMVYGIYNAGKSSIINELLGSDEAKVNDKPETAVVQEFEWNGYTLADTPGVGAPMDHEKITDENLKKADIVLFVMSTTGSTEKKDNYDRLKEIVSLGKKVIIILNDKNGDLYTNDSELQIIESKVKDNLQAVGLQRDDFVITIVNAKRANKGRLENKEKLVEKSNIQELKNILLSELKLTDDYIIINNAIVEILNDIETLKSYLSNDSNNLELDALNNLLDNIRIIKRNMKSEISDFINLKVSKLLPVVESDVWSNVLSETPKDTPDNIIQKHIENLYDVIIKKLENIIESANENIFDDITNVSKELESKIKNYENERQSISINMTTDDNSSNKAEFYYDNNVIDKMKDILSTSQKLLEAYKNNKSIIPIIVEGMGLGDFASIGIIEAGKGLLSSLAKTTVGGAILSSSVGGAVASAASVVAPYLAPIIGVVYTISKFFGNGKSKKEIEAENAAKNEAEIRKAEALKEARLDLHSKLDYFFDNLSTDLQNQINKVIDDVIGTYEMVYGEKISGSEKDKAQYDETMRIISNVESSYEELSIKIRNNH